MYNLIYLNEKKDFSFKRYIGPVHQIPMRIASASSEGYDNLALRRIAINNHCLQTQIMDVNENSRLNVAASASMGV